MLSNLFKCKHPANELIVQKAETTEQQDKDYNVTTYHFKCGKCDAEVKIKYSSFVGGVKAFLAREQ